MDLCQDPGCAPDLLDHSLHSMAWDSSRHLTDAVAWFKERRSRRLSEKREKRERKKMMEAVPETAPACAPLQVKVSIQFMEAVSRSTHNRQYSCSRDFEPSERFCNGLLRRIEHCSRELITRKDSAALEAYSADTSSPKPLRYRMTFQIVLRDQDVWAERTFESYQKQPLSLEAARNVVLSGHRTVGLFLRYHDRAFRWAHEPFEGQCSEKPETVKPTLGEPLPLSCIPRSRFFESSQSFEFVPGYTLEFSFHSRSSRRKGTEWSRTVRIDSRQNSPLNLSCGEDLLWQASSLVSGALDSQKQKFDREHGSCEGFEGVAASCQHFEQDALEVNVKVVNNLGPEYDHLQRGAQTMLGLFRHPDGIDCHNFVCDLQVQLMQARDQIDTRVSQMRDFEFRVVDVRGPSWKVRHTPLVFGIDAGTTHCSLAIQGLLDRVQTGIAEVLHGNDIAIHASAYKRGHLVLDKAIIAHEEAGKPAERFSSPREQQSAFIARLRERIQRDIDMVCKDTCSLEEPSEPVAAVLAEPGPRAAEEEATPEVDSAPSLSAVSDEHSSVPAEGRPETAVSQDLESDISPLVGTETLVPVVERTDLVAPAEEAASELPDAQSPYFSGEPPLLEGDEHSSRPSTPGLSLSSGEEASPRNSILITPTCIRTMSGSKDPITRIFETEGDMLRHADSLSPVEEFEAEPIVAGPVVTREKPREMYPRSVEDSPLVQRAGRLAAAGRSGKKREACDDENDYSTLQPTTEHEPERDHLEDLNKRKQIEEEEKHEADGAEETAPTQDIVPEETSSTAESTITNQSNEQIHWPLLQPESEDAGHEPSGSDPSGLDVEELQPILEEGLAELGVASDSTTLEPQSADGTETSSEASVEEATEDSSHVQSAGTEISSQDPIGEPSSASGPEVSSQSPIPEPSTPCRARNRPVSYSDPVTPLRTNSDSGYFGAAAAEADPRHFQIAASPRSPSVPKGAALLPSPMALSCKSVLSPGLVIPDFFLENLQDAAAHPGPATKALALARRPRFDHRRQMSTPTAGYFGLPRSPIVTPGIRSSFVIGIGSGAASPRFEFPIFRRRTRRDEALDLNDDEVADEDVEKPGDAAAAAAAAGEQSDSEDDGDEPSGARIFPPRQRAKSFIAGVGGQVPPDRQLRPAPPSRARPQTAYEGSSSGSKVASPTGEERGLPRAMMIFAGVTLVSQLLNKSS